jgi:hypothetical protein
VSWLLNSRGWRSGSHGFSDLPRGSATYSLSHHPVGSDWLTVWMRPLDSLVQSWLQGRRQTLSRRPYGLWLHRLRAGHRRWVVFSGGITIHGGGAARGSDSRYGHQWSLIGELVCVGCRLAIFFRTEIQAGTAWVWARRRPDRGSGGHPPDPSARSLRLTSVACSSLGHTLPS